jgi:hypothetical protein
MRRTFAWLSAAVAMVVCLTPPVAADRVVLTNGNFLEGRAEVLADGSVAVTSAMGTWTVAAHRVARVERTETVEERVEAVLAAAPKGDPAVLYDLAVWSRDQGAETLARQLAQRAIELDAGYEPARRLLGYRFHDGRWLTEEEWRRATVSGSAPGRDAYDAQLARELAWREARARLEVESARLELAARDLAERESWSNAPSETYGFPIGWVLAAPSVPSAPFYPIPGLGHPLSAPVQNPVRTRAPSAPRASIPSPPVANRSSFLPPGG